MGGPSHFLFALLPGCCLISWDASDFTVCCSGAGDKPRFLNGLLSTVGCAGTVCSCLPPIHLRGSFCGPGADKSVAGTPCAHPMAQSRKALPMTHCWLLHTQRWQCLCCCGAWHAAAPRRAGPPTEASVKRVSWGISHICKKYWL